MKLSKIWIIQIIIQIIVLVVMFYLVFLVKTIGLGIEPETVRINVAILNSFALWSTVAVTLYAAFTLISHIYAGSAYYKKIIIPIDKFHRMSYNNDITIVFNNDLHVYPKWRRKYIIPRIKDGLPITEYYTIKKKFLSYSLNI